MNKRVLRRLPVAEASCDDTELVKRIPQVGWLMKAKREQTEDGEYLVVSFFAREELLEGNRLPKLRTFFDREGYLSESMEEGKSCWKAGSRRNLIGIGYHSGCVSASAADEGMIREWFGTQERSALDSIDIFQGKVMKMRLEKRHQKMREKIEGVMQCVPKLPDGFGTWIDQSFMWKSRYFFYQYARKKRLEGFCSQCRQKMTVDRSLLRNGKQIRCPVCGKELTAKPVGRMERCRCDDGVTVLLQKAGERLVLRFFYVRKYYRRESPKISEIDQKEYIRLFFDGKSWERYEWTRAGYYFGRGWVPERHQLNSSKVVLCPIDLKEAIGGTPFAFSGVTELASRSEERSVDVPWYLDAWQKHPELEKLLKCGFYRLFQDFYQYSYQYKMEKLLDGKKSKLYQVLKLPGKACYAALPKEIGCAELAFVQEYCSVSQIPRPEVIQKCTALHMTQQHLLDYLKYASLEKLLEYCSAHTTEKDRENFLSSWFDYLEWCEKLDYDLRDSYYLFPKDFQGMHDRIGQEYRKKRDELERKRLMQVRRKVTLRMKTVRKQLGDISDEQLQIVVPKSAGEIEEEGKRLHHCVASYVPKVADKKTLILFLRKKEAADVPFRTLEWRNGDFKQCQGGK